MGRLFYMGLMVILACPGQASGQEQLFFYGTNTRPVDEQKEAVLMKTLRKRSDKRYTIKTERKVGGNWHFVSRERIRQTGEGRLRILIKAGTFFPDKIIRQMEELEDGSWYFEETTGNRTIREGHSSRYLPLHLHGTVKEYYPNGQVRSISRFRDNQLQSNRNWLSDGTPYIDSIFFSVDQEPEYQMGDEFFRKYLLGSIENSEIDLNQINDRVVLGWVIMETGEMKGVVARQGRIRQLNQFLVNAIARLPGSWEPAVLDGEIVRYYMSVPLNFIHDHVTFQELEISSGVLHYDAY